MSMHRNESGRILTMALIAIVLAGGLGFLSLAAFRAGSTPQIAAEPAGGSIGRKTAVTVTVTEPARGLSRVLAELVQGDRVEKLAEKSYAPPPPWSFGGSGTGSETLTLDIGRDAIKGLKAGPATLRVTAEGAPAWLRHPAPAVKELTFQVRLTPPSLGVTSTFHFARQGGSEAVVYRVGDSSVRDGVQAGELLENFLSINRDLRKANAAALVELASKSKPQFLWSRPFLPMPNAKVMAPFAEARTYVYQGRAVDHQTHLGFDLAVTKAVAVPASNDGVVALARFFGTVVVDHGYGLQSLYAHLSSIDVKEGQEVKRGDTLGRSGDTGLAGGDHLHFSILLAGQPVNPQEWWDAHWIRDRVVRKLGGALRFED